MAPSKPTALSTEPKGDEVSNIIPFRESNPSIEVSRVQIATLVDKLMEMPEDIDCPTDFNLHDKARDPFECIAEKILSDF